MSLSDNDSNIVRRWPVIGNDDTQISCMLNYGQTDTSQTYINMMGDFANIWYATLVNRNRELPVFSLMRKGI